MSQQDGRNRIDEYLDDALAPVERRDLEAAMAQDAAASRLMSRMQNERAQRAAVYASYTPSTYESSRLAESVMAAAHQPVGFVGQRVRRMLAVAAAVAVLVGTFAAGYRFGGKDTPITTLTVTKTVYSVLYTDALGETQEREFTSNDDRIAYIKDVEQRGASGFRLADGPDVQDLIPAGRL